MDLLLDGMPDEIRPYLPDPKAIPHEYDGYERKVYASVFAFVGYAKEELSWPVEKVRSYLNGAIEQGSARSKAVEESDGHDVHPN